jgi:hypothetical protein
LNKYPPSPSAQSGRKPLARLALVRGFIFFGGVVVNGLQWVGVIALVSLAYWFVAAVFDTFGGD